MSVIKPSSTKLPPRWVAIDKSSSDSCLASPVDGPLDVPLDSLAASPKDSLEVKQWAATIQPSRIFQRLSIAFATFALLSALTSGFPLWLNSLALLAALAMQLRQYKHLQVSRHLSHCDDIWHIEDHQGSHGGLLHDCSYRGAWLIILEIETHRKRSTSLVIWRDSLDPSDFSYLHSQLMKTFG